MTHGGDLIVQLMDFDGCTAENTALNQHAAVFQMVDLLSTLFAFDTGEYRYALTEDTAYQASKAYYSYSGNAYVLLVVGTDYTIGSSIPSESVYEANPNKSGDTNSSTNNGSNTWSDSCIRMFLNSEEAKGSWFKKQKIWDTCSYANNYDGFLRGLDSSLKACLVPVRRTVAVANGWGWRSSSTTIDRIFLPTRYELKGLKNNEVNEGKKQWEYWSTHKENEDRIKTCKEVPEYWWLSSPNASLLANIYMINSSGIESYYYTYIGLGISLCFCV